MSRDFPRRRGATAGLAHSAPQSDPWFSLYSQWVNHLTAEGLSPKTITKHGGFLVRFIVSTGLDPAVVTERDVEEFLARTDPRGPTRAGYIHALRSYYGWAAPRGFHEDNPVAFLRSKEPKYPPPVSLTRDEFTRVVYAASNRRPYPKRALTIILAIETGARIGSLAAVTSSDCGTEPGQLLRFRIAKGDRPYSVPLTPLAAWAVRGLLANANGTLLAVSSNTIWRWYHDAATEAGLPLEKRRAHRLRDSFATNLLMRGENIRVVQELLNHADLSQMHRYTAVTDKRKRTAMGRSVAETFDD
jgi:integrase/recombinase XerD